MKKAIFVLLSGLTVYLAYGQISFMGSYTQDFNTLASSGTSSVVPTGWAFLESGTNANTLYAAGTGSSTTGDTYSFGASGNSERAFGGLLSGSLTPTIGANIANNTGSTLTSITLSYTGELWRYGAAGRRDSIMFQISTDATSLGDGTWTSCPELNFITPSDTFTTGAKNGNSSPYRTGISYTITGLSIGNGNSFWIRWADANVTSSDDGLAVDDFSMTVPSTPNISVNPASLDFDTLLLNDTLELSYVVTGSNLTSGIIITAPAGYKISLTSGSGYVSCDTIPQSGGSVPPTTVYAVFLPTSTEGTRSGNITHASSGAATQNVAVSGYGTKIRLLSGLSGFGGVVVGQQSAEQYYRLAASGLVADGNLTVTAPTDFLASKTSGSGFATSFNIRADGNGDIPEDTVYVVFSPSTTGTRSDSISHSSSGAISRYLRVYGRGVASEPTVQASNIQFSGIDSLSMIVNWNRGNGLGCIVVARCEAPLSNVPLDGYFYTASDSFGKGSGTGVGHYVVYKGAGTSVTVNKLYGITTYHFAVFEYNGTDSCENYLTSTYPSAYQITNSMSGKISLNSLGSAYAQDFDALDTVTQALPTGWNYREEGSQANYSYAADSGNTTTGNIISYGKKDSSDRAFGSLQTGNLVPSISAVFSNNTGGTIHSLDFVFKGELWRLGGNRFDTLKFELSTTASTWVSYPSLDFRTPDTTGSVSGANGARNGNLGQNREYLWFDIIGLNIPNGTDFRIRWMDANASGADDGLAIDDFRLIPFNGNSLPRIIATTPADTNTGVARNAPVMLVFSEPMNPDSLVYSCSPNPGGWSASWSATGDTVTLSHSNFSYYTNYTFQVTKAKDLEGLGFVTDRVPNPFTFKTEIDPAAPPMYIWVLDVGQGDGMLIQSPADTLVMFDAGDNGYGNSTVWPILRDSLHSRHLHYTIASHYHSDHIGGIDEVIGAMGGSDSVKVAGFDRGSSYASGTYDDYTAALGSKRKTIKLDTVITLGKGAELRCVCVNGTSIGGNVSPSDENDYGIGMLLTYGQFKMTMTGDIGGYNAGGYKDIESLLARTSAMKEVSVVKVNHHASSYSTNDAWVDSLDPKAAVISLGDGNPYSYPTQEALARLCDDPKDEDTLYIYQTETGVAKGTIPSGRGEVVGGHIKIEVTSQYFVVNRSDTFWLQGGPMAVHLSSFAASLSGKNVTIRWRTESEDGTYRWEIERSDRADGGFEKIGTLPGHGTTSQPNDYEFTDRGMLSEGTYWYRLCEVELDGGRNYHGPVSVEFHVGGVWEFALGQARPNPFSQITTINYQITRTGQVSLKVYNVLGQVVGTLVDGTREAGRHQVVWDGRDGGGRKVSSGVYYLRLVSNGNRMSERILLLR